MIDNKLLIKIQLFYFNEKSFNPREDERGKLDGSTNEKSPNLNKTLKSKTDNCYQKVKLS